MPGAVPSHRAALGTHAVDPTRRLAALVVRCGLAGCRVARRALQRLADPTPPALRADDPWTFLPRWTVADVLPMTALEQRDPVAVLVLLEADHEALHRDQLRVRRDVGLRSVPRGVGTIILFPSVHDDIVVRCDCRMPTTRTS